MPAKSTDVHLDGAELFFLPVKTRMPLKFGGRVVTEVTCARARVWVKDRAGRRAEGWGETPLSAQWVWPSPISYSERASALQDFCARIGEKFARFDAWGHALEVGDAFQHSVLPDLLRHWNDGQNSAGPMPWLAALVCFSPFDLALHDAYGKLHQVPVFETYNARFMNRDLGDFLEPASESVKFAGKFPEDFLRSGRRDSMFAWHLVGGLDPLDRDDLKGDEPQDGHPVLLEDWIARDGLKCLKIKLRGDDANWDIARLLKVARIGFSRGVDHLSADFNCTAPSVSYVNEVLGRARVEFPECYERISYVEQPFPYDLEANPIDVREISKLKPLFLDESAHDWRLVRFGRELGWSGVALKTCKTLSGALLTAAWAKAHGMPLMVQDLTNPMLAQLSHLLLAAHVETLMGVETNSMQFYPDASLPEAAVHPGAFRRRNGMVDISTMGGFGLQYQLEEIHRDLPEGLKF
jgi:L-alanine-DL-glutamate epimerase-like enolase superfamily enzyme